VSLRMSVELPGRRDGYLVTRSSDDGRFTLERIGSGWHSLRALDEEWELGEDCDTVELEPGQSLDGLVLTVHPRVQARAGRLSGVLRIASKTPGAPVMLALKDTQDGHLPSSMPHGATWTDAEGHFEFSDCSPGDYHLVPKHAADRAAGGWRDFASEFAAHGGDWPWKVTVPEFGATQVEIDLPPESEWARPAAESQPSDSER
jgi:hypothetical protein